MKIGLIGFGQAGGKIAEELVLYDEKQQTSIVEEALAINSARSDLQGLSHILDSHKLVIGTPEVKSHGVGADNELGAKVARNDLDHIMNSVSNFPTHKIDAFVITTALGGGTGSGGTPVLSEKLQERYDNIPTYIIGVLPGNEGGLPSLNAARSFKTCIDKSDGMIMFDNASWQSSGESSESGYKKMNEQLVERIGMLFSAGEVTDPDIIGETVVDASEIMNTLGTRSIDTGGITTIGYSSTKIPEEELSSSGGLLSRLKGGSSSGSDSIDEETIQETNRIIQTVRDAVNGKLTLPGDITTTQRALVVIAGPPEKLNRKGLEEAKQWVEQETNTMEVRSGDYPLPNANHVYAIVALAGVSQSDRIKEIQDVGARARAEKDKLNEQVDNDIENLISTTEDNEEDQDDLEELF
jgi:cell division GTPase FtsZ